MDIIINTCRAYYKQTLPPLISSLKEAGVEVHNIHVVVGDADDFSTEVYNDHGITLHFVPYKNIDENGLFWACLHANKTFSAYIFYIHDTSQVHPNFAQNCIEWGRKLEANGYDGAKLRTYQSMCVGFYSSNLFQDLLLKTYLHQNKNFNDTGKSFHKRHCEDRLFLYLQNHGRKIYILPNANINDSIIDRDIDRFDTGVHRYVEYFEIPGVYKYKTGTYNMAL